MLCGISVTAVGSTKSFTFSSIRIAVDTTFALSGSVASAENIAFSWTTVAGSDEYRIEISSDGIHFFGSSVIGDGQTSYEFSGFDPGDSFIFRAVAMSGGADLKASNLVTVTMPAEQESGEPVEPSEATLVADPAAPGDRRWVVGFNGMYLNNPLESIGNQWFERIIRDTGETVRSPLPGSGQQSYNYNDRKLALGDLYRAIDTNGNQIITFDEAHNARVAVLGYSLGGVEAATTLRSS